MLGPQHNKSRIKKLTLFQVNTSDIGGGAEKISYSLHKKYKLLGYSSKMLVGRKRSDDHDVHVLDNSNRAKGFGVYKIFQEKLMGRQYLDYPGSYNLLKSAGNSVDILHFHNLHGGYFDLGALPELAKAVPVVLTLHDAWLLTGHCAQFLKCQRWREGCGNCPDLSLPPAISFDGTRYNLLRKKNILSAVPLFITAPSQWLLDQVDGSYLKNHHKCLIYNGVDQSIFSLGNKEAARQKLGLPQDSKIVLFCATSGLMNKYKGGHTLLEALQILLSKQNKSNKKILLISIGGGIQRKAGLSKSARSVARILLGLKNEEAVLKRTGLINHTLRIGKVTDSNILAEYYRAADVLAYPSIADNCPLTVLEALSCGLPVIGTDVGGIPELIIEGKTGFIINSEDPGELAQTLYSMFNNDSMTNALALEAHRYSLGRFDIVRQAKDYLELYGNVIAEWHRNI